jgi:hypothetical protein
MALFIHQTNDNDEEWLIEGERRAAQEALRTGMYVTWRSSDKEDCTRVDAVSHCQHCDCAFALHERDGQHRCTQCRSCTGFAFIPHRPEEIGEWWLPRRRDYVPGEWRLKCSVCEHPHHAHRYVEDKKKG